MSIEWNPNDPDATRVHYDLASWTIDQQAELAGDLADAEIPHAWEETELVVPEDAEAAVDLIIAGVEERLGIVDEVPGDLDEPDPEPIELAHGVEATEYDLAEWEDKERATVSRALARGEVPFRWDAKRLLVGVAHEELVDGILDAVESGELVNDEDDLGADSEGRLPFETLTTFFLAGERLQRNPLDPDGLDDLLKALDVADPARVPYGVEPRLWQRTCELADELADTIADGDEPDTDAAVEVATELHDLLRPFV